MADESTRKPTRLVLLDRDGVVNLDSPDYIKSAEEWHPLPGSLMAIAQLNEAGIYTALCSNQAGISRGRLTAPALAAIHVRFSRELKTQGGQIHLWRFCPHLPKDKCSCRKPNPAMLTDCMDELSVAPDTTVFIGDSLTDMKAAISAGCLPILVRSGNGAAAEAAAEELGVREIVDDLAAAADRVLAINTQLAGAAELPVT